MILLNRNLFFIVLPLFLTSASPVCIGQSSHFRIEGRAYKAYFPFQIDHSRSEWEVSEAPMTGPSDAVRKSWGALIEEPSLAIRNWDLKQISLTKNQGNLWTYRVRWLVDPGEDKQSYDVASVLITLGGDASTIEPLDRNDFGDQAASNPHRANNAGAAIEDRLADEDSDLGDVWAEWRLESRAIELRFCQEAIANNVSWIPQDPFPLELGQAYSVALAVLRETPALESPHWELHGFRVTKTPKGIWYTIVYFTRPHPESLDFHGRKRRNPFHSRDLSFGIPVTLGGHAAKIDLNPPPRLPFPLEK